MTEAATIAQAADILVARALERHRRRGIYFGMIQPNRDTPPTVPTTWRRKNIFGVTFPLSQVEEARAWAVAALEAGYRPFIFAGQGHAGFLPKEVDLVRLAVEGPSIEPSRRP